MFVLELRRREGRTTNRQIPDESRFMLDERMPRIARTTSVRISFLFGCHSV